MINHMETTTTNATAPAKTGAILDLISNLFGTSQEFQIVSEEDIRQKAYLLWEEAGRPDSDGVEFWLRAESEFVGNLPQSCSQ